MSNARWSSTAGEGYEGVYHGVTTLTDAATSIVSIAHPAGSWVGGSIVWMMRATDGADYQARTGRTYFASVNKAGAFTSAVDDRSAVAVSAGTMTETWALTAADPTVLQITPVGSLVETTYEIEWVLTLLVDREVIVI